MILLALALALLAPTEPPPAPGETPCRTVNRPADYWGGYQSKVTVGAFTLVTLKGSSSCSFEQAGAGRCSLIRAGKFLVTVNDQETWFEAPEHRGVALQIRDWSVACNEFPLVRTD